MKAISVLTNYSHFGMKIDRLWRIRKQTTKPILRKDFIFTEYQVQEARAFGADAILLMANVLSADRLLQLGGLANDLGMDVLYESHTPEEIKKVPAKIAKIWGVNCRKLDSRNEFGRYSLSRVLKSFGLYRDFSIEDKPLELVNLLPKKAIKVAESGITPSKVSVVAHEWHYNAALVGNSLLLAQCGIEQMLERFETALHAERNAESPAHQTSRLPAFS